jgi:hypothetical protein
MEKVIHQRIFKGWNNAPITLTVQLRKIDSRGTRFISTTDNGWTIEDAMKALGHLDEVKQLITLDGCTEEGIPVGSVDVIINSVVSGQKNLKNLQQYLRLTDEDIEKMTDVLKEIDARAQSDWDTPFTPSKAEKLRLQDNLIERQKKAIKDVLTVFVMPRWRREAEQAIAILQQPTYVDPELDEQLLDDPRKDALIRIDKEILTCTNVCDNAVDVDQRRTYTVFKDHEAAGEAARDYWKDMAENDSKEFVCIVGEETLVQWGLGQPAGPGSSSVCSLSEWLDLWLDTPEEHFAGYDGLEIDCTISAALAEDMGIANPDDTEWVDVVAYRN